MNKANYCILTVLILSLFSVKSQSFYNEKHFKEASKIKSKDFINEMKEKQASAFIESGSAKPNKKLEDQIRYNALLQHHVSDFNSEKGLTPAITILYRSLNNLFNELKDVNTDLYFINIQHSTDSLTNSEVLIITDPYGRSISVKDALYHLYFAKSKINAIKADRAAVAIAILLVASKENQDSMDIMIGLNAIAEMEMSGSSKYNMSEHSMELNIDEKALTTLNEYIKVRVDQKEAEIDKMIEKIKATDSTLQSLKL